MVAATPQYSPEYLAANRWNEFFIPYVILWPIAMTCILLRFFSSWLASRAFWWDDFAAACLFIFAIVHFATTYEWQPIGYGRHIVVALSMRADALTTWSKYVIVDEILYALMLAACKTCVLGFLWRIFGRTSMRYYILVLLGVTLSWCIAVVITSILACIPVRASWDLTILASDKQCIDQYKFYIGISFPNIITDFAITLLPIPYVWRLNVKKRQKMLVAFTLLFGSIASIVSAIRLASIMGTFSLVDPTWDTVTLMRWSLIEVEFAKISVCLPTFRPLLRLITGSKQDSTSASSDPHSGDPSAARDKHPQPQVSKKRSLWTVGSTVADNESQRGLATEVGAGREDVELSENGSGKGMGGIHIRKDYSVH